MPSHSGIRPTLENTVGLNPSHLERFHGMTTPHGAYYRPPIDGSLTIPEIFDWHAEHNPQYPLFVYPDDYTLKYITMKEAAHGMHRAARHYSSYFTSLGHPPAIRDSPVVALFALTDTVTYFCTWMGIARAGYTVFHISPRNSSAALAHLLRHRNVVHVLTSPEPGIEAIVTAALTSIGMKEDQRSTFVSEMPDFEFLFKAEPDAEPLPKGTFDSDGIICYIHSSGTTNFPKPVPYKNKTYVDIHLVFEGAHDFQGQVLAVQSLSMFHGLGIVSVVMAACTGVIFSTFKPQTPAIVTSPEAVWQAAITTRADYIFVVPVIIEAWAGDRTKVERLADTKGLLYGGGPLSTAIGNYLTKQGVDVYVTYGASENGMKAPILPAPPGMDWEYFIILPSIHAEFVDYGNGTYELVVVDSPTHTPRLFNTKWNGVDAYATGDLLVPHPTKEGFWKIFGRADDQIMLSNGEKTNPGPLEDILCEDPKIQAVIMFGRGRFQSGAIVQPAPGYVVQSHDEKALAEFRRAIWPTVKKMNEFAPQHSRLFKEMILVASPEKPFLYTPKGSMRRSATLNSYETEIEAVYEAVAEAAQEDIAAPLDWSAEDTLRFVRQVVSGVTKAEISDDDDLFQHGCDSLQATWIRNSISRAVRKSDMAIIDSVPESVVYSHPSIKSLANFCSTPFAPGLTAAKEQEAKQKVMLELVDKYTQNISSFSTSSPAMPAPDYSVVVVTGTTGSFGSSLLAALISSPAVSVVYALNRPSSNGEALPARQRRSFVERGLDEGTLDSDKLSLLEADLSDQGLGLSPDILERMRSSVTGIIHNAWRVDFNLALGSFESSLTTVRSLIDFALSTRLSKPPRIVFTSSVSVLRNAVRDGPAAEVELEDPAVAVGSGYAESKWVAESVLSRASAVVPALETVVVRVGQLAGGPTGAWNATEWFPAIVRSGPLLGCLPEQDADVAWIPLHVAADAILEMTVAAAAPSVLHLAHPRPVPWSSVLSVVARELNVPLVSYADWLRALEESVKDPRKSEVDHMRANPALRLLPFFRGVQTGRVPAGYEAMGLPLMDTRRAQEVAPGLRCIAPLGEADVLAWLEFWKAMHVL